MTTVRVSRVAHARLATFSVEGRARFLELLDDAPTELQREVLLRALVAGHTANELHAFADELRPLADPEVMDALTLSAKAQADLTMAQRLRAEADPLWAFELNGRELSPEDEPTRPLDFDVVAVAERAAGAAPGKVAFEAESAPVGAPPLLHDVLAEASRGLVVRWREMPVDERNVVTVVDLAIDALTTGGVVPALIGPKEGRHQRVVVMLQAAVSGKNRAVQLFDPLSNELAWANEADLKARRELPFAAKVHRTLTLVAVPTPRGRR